MKREKRLKSELDYWPLPSIITHDYECQKGQSFILFWGHIFFHCWYVCVFVFKMFNRIMHVCHTYFGIINIRLCTCSDFICIDFTFFFTRVFPCIWPIESSFTWVIALPYEYSYTVILPIYLSHSKPCGISHRRRCAYSIQSKSHSLFIIAWNWLLLLFFQLRDYLFFI